MESVLNIYASALINEWFGIVLSKTFLSEKLIGSKANLSILERLDSSIKGKDERDKFFKHILEKDPTNQFVSGKMPSVRLNSGEEGQMVRILEKMPTDDGFLKLVEGNNIEYKKSWYL